MPDPISLGEFQHDARGGRVSMAMSVAIDVGQLDPSLHDLGYLRVPFQQQIAAQAWIRSHSGKLVWARKETAFRVDEPGNFGGGKNRRVLIGYEMYADAQFRKICRYS